MELQVTLFILFTLSLVHMNKQDTLGQTLHILCEYWWHLMLAKMIVIDQGAQCECQMVYWITILLAGNSTVLKRNVCHIFHVFFHLLVTNNYLDKRTPDKQTYRPSNWLTKHFHLHQFDSSVLSRPSRWHRVRGSADSHHKILRNCWLRMRYCWVWDDWPRTDGIIFQ